jgi:hypothetical protein
VNKGRKEGPERRENDQKGGIKGGRKPPFQSSFLLKEERWVKVSLCILCYLLETVKYCS